MKKIFLYADCIYANKNYELVIDELKRQSVGDIEFVDVNAVPDKYAFEIINRAHVVILDHSIIFALNFYKAEDLLSYYENIKSESFYFDLVSSILKLDIPIIYVQSMVDIHNVAIYEFDNFFKSIQAIVWLYHSKPAKKQEIPESLADRWMNDYQCPYDNWQQITKNVPSKFQMLHCLSEDEYEKVSVQDYKWDVSICGERYAPRKQAMLSVKRASSIRIAPYRRNDLAICGISRALTTLKVPAKWLNPKFIKIRQQHQRYILRNSLTSFTCGSAYLYPVRKFFEIPVARSLLLAYPFSGMNDCGFEPGINYIAINDFSEVSDQIKAIKSNPSLATKMVDNCFDMIKRLHSLQKRVADLRRFIDFISEGKQIVAEFSAGEFVFNHES